ncbi:hypothetical protein ACJ41O_005604 [Fusarium nematophilum]
MFVWSTLEVWVIRRAITTDRDANFSSLFGPKPTLASAVGYALAMQAAMYAVVVLGTVFMGEGCFMQWFCLTNIVMAVAPANEALSRGSRKGLSLGFCLVTVIGTVGTFAPWGFWALALPEAFAQPVYYAAGVVFILYSVWGFYTVSQYKR